jgi:hypothetical protein
LQALFELQRAARLLRALLAEAAEAARRNGAEAARLRQRSGGGGGSKGIGSLAACVHDISIGGEEGGGGSGGGANSSLPVARLSDRDAAELPRVGAWAVAAAGTLEECLDVLQKHGIALDC